MIYLDYAATAPVKPIALKAIEEAPYANPNSLHKPGLEAKAALLEAENLVKTHINGHKGRIVWLSTASLANAFVIKNVLEMPYYSPDTFICMKTAHRSIRNFGHEDTMLSPLESGMISMEELEKVTDATKLVSMLYVNNETGAIQPVDEIKPKIKKALYHVDAVQAASKLSIDVEQMQCDFLTMSGHKFGTPKGIACLWIRNKVEIDLPYLGTPQVPMAFAFAKTLASSNLIQWKYNMIAREALFRISLAESAKILKISYKSNTKLSHNPSFRWKSTEYLPGLLSIRFNGIDASELLMNLSDKGLAVSSGSACNSTNIVPSYVLTAMGISDENALSTIRISLSPENTLEELEEGVTILTNTVKDMYHDGSESSEIY